MKQQQMQGVMNAGQQQMPTEQPGMPMEQPMMPEQQMPVTGADLERENLSQLMANAVPQVNPDAAAALGQAGLPPQMGGMIPGAGLAGTPDQDMLMR